MPDGANGGSASRARAGASLQSHMMASAHAATRAALRRKYQNLGPAGGDESEVPYGEVVGIERWVLAAHCALTSASAFALPSPPLSPQPRYPVRCSSTPERQPPSPSERPLPTVRPSSLPQRSYVDPASQPLPSIKAEQENYVRLKEALVRKARQDKE